MVGGGGFHNSAVIVTPQDIAPIHSGSVFGLMNTFGSIPGRIKKNLSSILSFEQMINSHLRFSRGVSCWAHSGINPKLVSRIQCVHPNQYLRLDRLLSVWIITKNSLKP